MECSCVEKRGPGAGGRGNDRRAIARLLSSTSVNRLMSASVLDWGTTRLRRLWRRWGPRQSVEGAGGLVGLCVFFGVVLSSFVSRGCGRRWKSGDGWGGLFGAHPSPDASAEACDAGDAFSPVCVCIIFGGVSAFCSWRLRGSVEIL